LTDLINKNKKTGDTTKTVVPATKEEAKPFKLRLKKKKNKSCGTIKWLF
jgi:hypothetical protein